MVNTSMHARLGFACTSLLSACLQVADERAEIDARVGRAEAAGLAVEVEQGLAAVRELSSDGVELWAGAPSLEFTIHTERAGLLRLRILNAMPGGELRAVADDPSADADVLAPIERTQPTESMHSLQLSAGETRLRFSVPDAAEVASFRYAVFADVQEAIDSVQDIYERMNDTQDLRFVIMSGDLTEQGSGRQLRRFERELQGLDIPIFSTLGNHELGAGEGNYHRFFGRGSRHFQFKGAHFTLVDDASATIAPRVYGWLDDWLRVSRDGFHSVYMHLPPLDSSGIRNGAFASRAEADLLLTKLARGHVDLTIYGHVHTYDAYSNAGIPAFITGGGGAIPERFDHVGRHFLVVDVDPESQRFQTAIVRVD